MERNVVTESEAAVRRGELGDVPDPGQLTPDDYIDRLAKCVPTEVIGAHLTLQTAVSQIQDKLLAQEVGWGLFGIVVLGAPFYLSLGKGISKWQQILLCEVAFIGWAAALNGTPFNFDAPFRAIAAALATFLIPLIPPKR